MNSQFNQVLNGPVRNYYAASRNDFFVGMERHLESNIFLFFLSHQHAPICSFTHQVSAEHLLCGRLGAGPKVIIQAGRVLALGRPAVWFFLPAQWTTQISFSSLVWTHDEFFTIKLPVISWALMVCLWFLQYVYITVPHSLKVSPFQYQGTWTHGKMGYLNHRTRRAHTPVLTPLSKGASMLHYFSQVWLFATPCMDCRPPCSSVNGILQARTLEWLAVPSSRGPSRPRDRTQVSYISCIGSRVLYH